MSDFRVTASAGSLRAPEGLTIPHAWTTAGMVAEVQGTGADLDRLLARVDEVAEIPRVIRAGGGVERR